MKNKLIYLYTFTLNFNIYCGMHEVKKTDYKISL